LGRKVWTLDGVRSTSYKYRRRIGGFNTVVGVPASVDSGSPSCSEPLTGPIGILDKASPTTPTTALFFICKTLTKHRRYGFRSRVQVGKRTRVSVTGPTERPGTRLPRTEQFIKTRRDYKNPRCYNDTEVRKHNRFTDGTTWDKVHPGTSDLCSNLGEFGFDSEC
jgi:hypothetical protein